MGKLIVKNTKLQDVKLITPAVFGDNRGFFTESYSDRDFKAAGIDFDFIQDNHSLSTRPASCGDCTSNGARQRKPS